MITLDCYFILSRLRGLSKKQIAALFVALLEYGWKGKEPDSEMVPLQLFEEIRERGLYNNEQRDD